MKYSYDDLGFGGCVVVLLVVAIIIALIAWAFQALWNWLVPIFWSAAPMLTYWQSLGIYLLLSIIGGFFRSSNSN